MRGLSNPWIGQSSQVASKSVILRVRLFLTSYGYSLLKWIGEYAGHGHSHIILNVLCLIPRCCFLRTSPPNYLHQNVHVECWPYFCPLCTFRRKMGHVPVFWTKWLFLFQKYRGRLLVKVQSLEYETVLTHFYRVKYPYFRSCSGQMGRPYPLISRWFNTSHLVVDMPKYWSFWQWIQKVGATLIFEQQNCLVNGVPKIWNCSNFLNSLSKTSIHWYINYQV